MLTISPFRFLVVSQRPISIQRLFSHARHSLVGDSLPRPHMQSLLRKPLLRLKCSSGEESCDWLQKLPEKKKALYSHSLPCVEAWLRSLGFYQSRDDSAVWFVEKHDWHAQVSLDVTDLYIRYLKSGPGNLEKDVERRFSYALSREDIENAILGGP